MRNCKTFRFMTISVELVSAGETYGKKRLLTLCFVHWNFEHSNYQQGIVTIGATMCVLHMSSRHVLWSRLVIYIQRGPSLLVLW